jgi:hypothetical protein
LFILSTLLLYTIKRRVFEWLISILVMEFEFLKIFSTERFELLEVSICTFRNSVGRVISVSWLCHTLYLTIHLLTDSVTYVSKVTVVSVKWQCDVGLLRFKYTNVLWRLHLINYLYTYIQSLNFGNLSYCSNSRSLNKTQCKMVQIFLVRLLHTGGTWTWRQDDSWNAESIKRTRLS